MPEGTLFVDEPVDQRWRGSSSLAKKIEAAFKISLASRRSAFSFFSRLISASSSLLGPGRAPASVRACNTHLRSVSGPIPSLGPNACATAPAEPYSSSRSKAIRVARSRCSAGYLLGMICILRKKGSGIKPGTVQDLCGPAPAAGIVAGACRRQGRSCPRPRRGRGCTWTPAALRLVRRLAGAGRGVSMACSRVAVLGLVLTREWLVCEPAALDLESFPGCPAGSLVAWAAGVVDHPA